jgi:dTDP-3-amino-3,4,6-trideoxy-alpha-D-glucose transaminase
MTVPFLDLARRVASLRPELDAAIARVLDSGRFVLGAEVEAFEEELAAYCGAGHAVGVASGTGAIELALRALGVGPGDEVVTAANTCVPTVAAIEAAGARPVLADVDSATLTLDPARLDTAVTERTRAIVPVHLYGQCADMGRILAFAATRGIAVVEDAAQALGAEWEGRRPGALGDAAAVSFYPTKNIGALGDGGAVVTGDADLAERVRLLRAYGERSGHDSVVPGTNSRLDELQAAVLRVELGRLDGWTARRRELAAVYRDELAGLPLRPPAEAEQGRHAYHLFVVRVPERDRLRAELAARGVETAVHYPRPVHGHPAYERLAREGALRESEQACGEVVSLPLYPELTDAEARTVVAAVREVTGRP